MGVPRYLEDVTADERDPGCRRESDAVCPVIQHDHFLIGSRALDDDVVRSFQGKRGEFREDRRLQPGPVSLDVHEVVQLLPLLYLAVRLPAGVGGVECYQDLVLGWYPEGVEGFQEGAGLADLVRLHGQADLRSRRSRGGVTAENRVTLSFSAVHAPRITLPSRAISHSSPLPFLEFSNSRFPTIRSISSPSIPAITRLMTVLLGRR
jgi:hypothetical protein